jgi:lipid II:glycine glycyltransferase (peptidoglycan interpeptide bridge formation enzyme)
LAKLKELAKGERSDFIRISPIIERTEENNKLFKDLGFRLRPLHTHPESSWKLNIEKPEEELLAGMRKTTRYLIKKAQEDKNIEIFQSFDLRDVETFRQMHLEVVKRQKFVPFSLEYFQKEFMAFIPDNQIALFIAKYKGLPIAASYGIFWSNMTFYHHAALLPEYKKIPAAYLLQWKAIKEAKKRGCKIYDFWGYSDPLKNQKHPYSGPTLFKMGFGGYKDEYVKTYDMPLSWKYWINYLVETVRKIKRRLY